MLAVRHIGKSYGAITVLDDISFIVNSNDRIGIVGSNGVGKTTLLNILIGKESHESGSFLFTPHTEVGYLPQTTPEFSGHTRCKI
jgi:macrolide transport system ATP-binding/permease protein